MLPVMRCLKINRMDLEAAFESGFSETHHYLHDDLRAVTLDSALIQAPPIELWPAVVPRVEVPADVEEVLLKPIREGLQSSASQQSSTKVEGQEHE